MGEGTDYPFFYLYPYAPQRETPPRRDPSWEKAQHWHRMGIWAPGVAESTSGCANGCPSVPPFQAVFMPYAPELGSSCRLPLKEYYDTKAQMCCSKCPPGEGKPLGPSPSARLGPWGPVP